MAPIYSWAQLVRERPGVIAAPAPSDAPFVYVGADSKDRLHNLGSDAVALESYARYAVLTPREIEVLGVAFAVTTWSELLASSATARPGTLVRNVLYRVVHKGPNDSIVLNDRSCVTFHSHVYMMPCTEYKPGSNPREPVLWEGERVVSAVFGVVSRSNQPQLWPAVTLGLDSPDKVSTARGRALRWMCISRAEFSRLVLASRRTQLTEVAA